MGSGRSIGNKTKKMMMKSLNDDCWIERMVKTWHEIGGRKQTEEERKADEVFVRKKKVKETGLVVEVDGKWKQLGKVKLKEIYTILLRRREGSLEEEDEGKSKAFKTLEKVAKKLTAKERDYWWRLKHKIISIRKTEKRWRRYKDGRLVTGQCQVCKEGEKHYDRGCRQIVEFRRRVGMVIPELLGDDPEEWAKKLDLTYKIDDDEWSLEKQGLDEKTEIIAKARWIYHCERCMIDMKKKKRLDHDQMIEKLTSALELGEKDNNKNDNSSVAMDEEVVEEKEKENEEKNNQQ